MSIIPKTAKKQVEYINYTVDKKGLNKLLSKIYREYGAAKTSFLANALKDLGFKYATKAGVTISIEDLDVPQVKKKLLSNAENEIEKAMQRYYKGEITEVERYTKVIDTWSETTAMLTQEVVNNFNRLNSIYMMAFSGARGNISQVSQLVGMRGLMADSQGQIIDLPIKSNFREGLSVTEYIISSYGARKGLVDTALKTADSGYLTRRLVDVAQDVIIQCEECNTDKYILMTPIYEGDKIIVHIKERLVGRTSLDDIYSDDGELLIAVNEIFDVDTAEKVEAHGITEVKVRSPLTCNLDYGICQSCYGWALTNNKVVDIGEAIGIIAAQSIGEPGTQLTMRTFHTGGVFKGSLNIQKIVAEEDCEVVETIKTREFRTRHGDIVNTPVRDGNILVKNDSGEMKEYHVPYGGYIHHEKGARIKKGEVVLEFDPGAGGRGDTGRLTEKATKDITADLSGQVLFDGFVADEKRDRQGNITRTANRGGIIWVLSGDVYNMPTGASLLVDNEQAIVSGEILAETVTTSEHGGEVRIGTEMETEAVTLGDEEIEIIRVGKEITVVIASLSPSNAHLETTKKEQMWVVDDVEETYIIKSPAGTIVENGMIIAELIDDKYTVASSGEIRYEDIEVDERRIVTSPGKLLFIPDEVHQISKDAALKLVESGTYVEAGTEVVKDVKAHIDGIVEIIEDNDIIHEVIIRPGEMYQIDDIAKIEVEDGDIVEAGTMVAPGIEAKEKCLVNINIKYDSGVDLDLDDDEDDEDVDVSNKPAYLLLRPVQEFDIQQRDISIKFESIGTDEELISIVPVTQLQFRDGDRVRQLTGASLTRTSLVLQMQGYLSHLKGLVEFDPKDAEPEDQNLKIVVLENLIVRREIVDPTRATTSTQTQLLVKDGQYIEPKTPVAKTQVLAEHTGKVCFNVTEDAKDLRRILILTPEQITKIPLEGQKAIVKEGEFVRMDQKITDEAKTIAFSGQVAGVDKNDLHVRYGRPYLISAGAQLQVNTGNFVQRGDLVATLIFERLKTGDIVQGLPRVEELLEARKPKESAILAEEDGEAELEYDEDLVRLFIVNESGRQEIKIPLGSNIIVTDKQKIVKGQPLTDGPLNPHDVLRLRDVEAVQQYLVDEVQRVYRSQGVDIADKHIEVIVRRMTKKVRIDESGNTQLLPGELIEGHIVDEENRNIEQMGGQPAEYHPILLGITKASLKTDSFISAASFQETTRVLTEAAVEGKKDMLRGLKENVIIGRLIPAGTGFYHLNFADDKPAEIIEDKMPKTTSRKPSAILEEIEGMFGSPDFTIE
ncbi:MAG: DNA-directed RNA polymerase subunit beta'' [Cyanobacteriota bacterium]